METSSYSAQYRPLCALLRLLREEAELTQVEVAGRLDVIDLRFVAEVLGENLTTVVSRLLL